MACIKRIPLRALALALCLLLAASPALSEGIRFSLRADADPAQYPADVQPLMEGLCGLLEASTLEGTLVTNGSSFALDAALLMDKSRTGFEVYGLDSHWGVRSTLLGEEELMVNLSSLLPFGQKASDWLGLPLDKASLLVPYTHADALQGVWEVLSPLFPAQSGTRYFPRDELNAMARAVQSLCDTDAALARYLETTGLYRTVTRYTERFLALPTLAVPGMTVTRTDSSLTWDVYFVNLLTLRQETDALSLRIAIPTMLTVTGSAQRSGSILTGTFHAQLDDRIQMDAAFTLPTTLSAPLSDLSLTIDADAPFLPEEGLCLSLAGEIREGTLILRQLHPETGSTMMTLTAELTAYSLEALPYYTPDDLTGVNVLSVNSDSLTELMHAVRKPLLTGLFDLLVAAPPEAVQALMDCAEDSGLLDLLADALSGGTGY